MISGAAAGSSVGPPKPRTPCFFSPGADDPERRQPFVTRRLGGKEFPRLRVTKKLALVGSRELRRSPVLERISAGVLFVPALEGCSSRRSNAPFAGQHSDPSD